MGNFVIGCIQLTNLPELSPSSVITHEKLYSLEHSDKENFSSSKLNTGHLVSHKGGDGMYFFSHLMKRAIAEKEMVISISVELKVYSEIGWLLIIYEEYA